MNVSFIRDHRRTEVLFGHGFEDWNDRYQQMRYANHDCMLQELVLSEGPFFWTDVLVRREISVEARRVVEDACNFGLEEGFVAPMRKSRESVLAVVLAGARCDTANPHVRATARLLSTCYGVFGGLICHLPSQNGSIPSLTVRQKDCLKWVGLGKSSTDIGAILGISPEVVDEHIQNACRRLGVRTRTQAAILISNQG